MTEAQNERIYTYMYMYVPAKQLATSRNIIRVCTLYVMHILAISPSINYIVHMYMYMYMYMLTLKVLYRRTVL